MAAHIPANQPAHIASARQPGGPVRPWKGTNSGFLGILWQYLGFCSPKVADFYCLLYVISLVIFSKQNIRLFKKNVSENTGFGLTVLADITRQTSVCTVISKTALGNLFILIIIKLVHAVHDNNDDGDEDNDEDDD